MFTIIWWPYSPHYIHHTLRRYSSNHLSWPYSRPVDGVDRVAGSRCRTVQPADHHTAMCTGAPDTLAALACCSVHTVAEPCARTLCQNILRQNPVPEHTVPEHTATERHEKNFLLQRASFSPSLKVLLLSWSVHDPQHATWRSTVWSPDSEGQGKRARMRCVARQWSHTIAHIRYSLPAKFSPGTLRGPS